jgi:ketosteroid isomerase-like protein
MKALLLPLLLLVCSCNHEEKKNIQNDNNYLIHAPKEWDSLFNTGKAAALAALYADNMISMPYDVASVNGIKSQRKELENLISQNPGVQHHTIVDEILVDDSFAIERAHYIMVYPASANSKQITESGRHIMCRKKINGKWKIAWEIWNKDKPLQ